MPDTSGWTLRKLLPERLERMTDTLRTELGESPTASRNALAWGFLGEQAGQFIGSVLDIDVFEVLAGAWCKARKLHEYADPARHPPGRTESVVLGEHEFTHTVHPVLEYAVGNDPVLTLRFDLDLVATIHSITLAVRDGYITAVGSGTGSVALQLSYRKKKLHEALKSKELPQLAYFKLKAPGVRIP